MASLVRRFVPLMDRVLVQKLRPELQTKAGLFLPESAGTSNTATVVRVGVGRLSRSGERLGMSVKEGDTVVIPEYGGMPLKLADEEYHVFRDEDLIGVVAKE
eukprot:GHVT01060442.1.p3 GENE.GHVT01060442.1~~GHVT01060442.1.p3  ORF type:complete len:102 (+),score=28.57 GHVT01060442.1:169-474(+)